MLYDVKYLNRKTHTTGLATDTVTGSKRYAIERAATLRERGTPAHVVNRHGDTVG
jgi:hypothetical protein